MPSLARARRGVAGRPEGRSTASSGAANRPSRLDATQAGKTTLLNALLAAGRPDDRVVTVEETFEIKLPVRDVVAMQCRQPSLEGTGEVTLRRLIKEALRMRPDRLVVGEVREAEAP